DALPISLSLSLSSFLFAKKYIYTQIFVVRDDFFTGFSKEKNALLYIIYIGVQNYVLSSMILCQKNMYSLISFFIMKIKRISFLTFLSQNNPETFSLCCFYFKTVQKLFLHAVFISKQFRNFFSMLFLSQNSSETFSPRCFYLKTVQKLFLYAVFISKQSKNFFSTLFLSQNSPKTFSPCCFYLKTVQKLFFHAVFISKQFRNFVSRCSFFFKYQEKYSPFGLIPINKGNIIIMYVQN
ncbi:MAG: hypothetical protein LBG80_08630, partial [Bacteroidales bacterium]|nr:hypothetical protein [Bacteroidales bacterium]